SAHQQATQVDVGGGGAAVAELGDLWIGQEVRAHACKLGALSRKEECDARHPYLSASIRATGADRRRRQLLGLDHFAAGIVAAVGADRMRAPGLLAVRARLDLHEYQRQMRAPATFPGF